MSPKEIEKPKLKTHKGLKKRLVVKSSGFYMKRTRQNKYATKKSSRNRSASKRTKLIKVPSYYVKVIKKLIPKRSLI